MSSSTASSIPTRLTESYMKESTSAFRFTLWVSFFFLVFLCISSSITRVCFNACAESIEYPMSPLNYRAIKFRKMHEDFTNEGSDFNFNRKIAPKYQSIPLTSNELDTSSNLMIGQMNRYITIENEKPTIILDMFANLYILGGNIFGENKTDQEYRAYAYTNSGKEKIDLGKLEKHPDNFYKLKITTNNANVLQYNKIEIVYKSGEEQHVLLTGSFDSVI